MEILIFLIINADLLQAMIINLGDPGIPVENPILRLMNVLLAAETGAEEKKQVLQEEFHIGHDGRIRKRGAGIV